MTTLRPGRAPASGRRSDADPADRVFHLGDEHRLALERLVDAAPLVNAMASARLRSTRSMAAPRLGATAIGFGTSGLLRAAAMHGPNLVPIGGDAESWRPLAAHLADTPRACTSIVGEAGTVAALWPRISLGWGHARAIRHCQPLLVLDRGAVLTVDQRVEVLGLGDLDAYLPAAAAMFTEELGISPLEAARSIGYRRRAEGLLRAGRSFGVFDGAGAIAFKADIGALTAHTCQIQGVWVRPDLRRRGLATSAMAEVLRRGLELAPTVSLYVNDFNEPARALYDRLGMREVAQLSTILF